MVHGGRKLNDIVPTNKEINRLRWKIEILRRARIKIKSWWSWQLRRRTVLSTLRVSMMMLQKLRTSDIRNLNIKRKFKRFNKIIFLVVQFYIQWNRVILYKCKQLFSYKTQSVRYESKKWAGKFWKRSTHIYNWILWIKSPWCSIDAPDLYFVVIVINTRWQ